MATPPPSFVQVTVQPNPYSVTYTQVVSPVPPTIPPPPSLPVPSVLQISGNSVQDVTNQYLANGSAFTLMSLLLDATANPPLLKIDTYPENVQSPVAIQLNDPTTLYNVPLSLNVYFPTTQTLQTETVLVDLLLTDASGQVIPPSAIVPGLKVFVRFSRMEPIITTNSSNNSFGIFNLISVVHDADAIGYQLVQFLENSS